jgi:hypothetical protein
MPKDLRGGLAVLKETDVWTGMCGASESLDSMEGAVHDVESISNFRPMSISLLICLEWGTLVSWSQLARSNSG